jgi:hypothetical protein
VFFIPLSIVVTEPFNNNQVMVSFSIHVMNVHGFNINDEIPPTATRYDKNYNLDDLQPTHVTCTRTSKSTRFPKPKLEQRQA